MVYQRIDEAGQRLSVDKEVHGDADTMVIFGMDHMITEQEASAEEIEAVQKFPTREGTRLLIGYHDVGVSSDLAERQMECSPRRSAGTEPAALRPLHTLPHEETGRTRGESMGPAPRAGARDKSACSVDCHEGPGYARMACRRYDVQFPPSPVALRAEIRRWEVDPRIGTTARGYLAPPPVH